MKQHPKQNKISESQVPQMKQLLDKHMLGSGAWERWKVKQKKVRMYRVGEESFEGGEGEADGVHQLDSLGGGGRSARQQRCLYRWQQQLGGHHCCRMKAEIGAVKNGSRVKQREDIEGREKP